MTNQIEQVILVTLVVAIILLGVVYISKDVRLQHQQQMACATKGAAYMWGMCVMEVK